MLNVLPSEMFASVFSHMRFHRYTFHCDIGTGSSQGMLLTSVVGWRYDESGRLQGWQLAFDKRGGKLENYDLSQLMGLSPYDASNLLYDYIDS